MSRTLWVGLPNDYYPWLNPYIWASLQSPLGVLSPPNPLTSGQPTYVWAKVTNNSDEEVIDATVRFFFSPYGTHFSRNRAVSIGYSSVSLAPQASDDVLCLTFWSPTEPSRQPFSSNRWHGCLIVEVHHYIDPLPAPSAQFDSPRQYTQVGYRGVNIRRSDEERSRL
jgi:hypothetical protein